MRIERIPVCFLIAAACGGEPTAPPVEEVPIDVLAPPTPSETCALLPTDQTMRVIRKVSGLWTGRVELSGEVTIPAGVRLEVCPGTVIAASDGAKIIVDGELVLTGTRESKIMFEPRVWEGIEVNGSLVGTNVVLTSGEICINGKEGSNIELTSSVFDDCVQAFRLRNGARFDHVRVKGGLGVYIEGGMVTMTDSVIDLFHPLYPPDCTYWLGGGGELDHVRFTGCHTPLHVLRAPDGMIATNSIFDGASLPVVIGETHGALNNNHIILGAPNLLDTGGIITLDLSGNYWGGRAPRIGTSNLLKFPGVENYSLEPLEGVGPRDLEE